MSALTTFLADVPEPRKSELQKVYEFISENAPDLPVFNHGKYLGFGPYHYKYSSGREGDWFVVGMANNKNSIALYICPVLEGRYLPETYKNDLGKATVGKSCINFKKLDDLNLSIVKKMLRESVKLHQK